MSDTPRFAPGTICWQDLTVPNAEEVRDFYAAVVGWTWLGEDMGGYEDYHMLPPGSDKSAAGVCHARGCNADVPPQWLVYINVADMAQSVAKVRELGGEVVVEPRGMGPGLFAVIRDPAGAMCALYQPS
ncbi:MAG: VOC family protein [Armatimonadota bacterium]